VVVLLHAIIAIHHVPSRIAHSRDPKPFQFVDQKRSGLTEAKRHVRQLKASLNQATAELEQSKASLKLQEDTHSRVDARLSANARAIVPMRDFG
jgi:hypothetical protein